MPAEGISTVRRAALRFTVCLAIILAYPPAAPAGEWRVSPIRLELGREARSGVITVVNEKPERLQVQMKAFEWLQDGEGKDRYEETADLLFFPKIIVFEKNEERIIRAGIRVPAAKTEKTYRLFIEEIPEPRKAQGASVAIAVRFGVPVFVKPLQEEVKGTIEKIAMADGNVEAVVRNGGNVHFVIQSVTVRGTDAQGQQTFAKELAGWYLLAGASRRYAAAVSPEACRKTARVGVEVKADRLTMTGAIDADTAMCGR